MQKDSLFIRVWRAVYPILLYFGIQFFAMFIVIFVYMIQATKKMDIMTGGFSAIYEFIYGYVQNNILDISYWSLLLAAIITLPFLWLFMNRDKKRQIAKGGYREYANVKPVLYLFVILLAAAACLVGNNLILLSGLMENSEGYEEMAGVLYGHSVILELVGVGILVPLTEELVFRGLVYKRLREYWPPLMAGVLACLAFSLFHGNLVQAVYAFFLGALIVYAYEKYHSLWAPILMHMTANLLSVILTETNALDAIYTSRFAFFAWTIGGCLVIIAMVYLIETKVFSLEMISVGPSTDTTKGQE